MLFAGSLIAVQSSSNSALGKYLSHPIHSAIVSFSSGLLILVTFAIFTNAGLPSPIKVISAPKFYLIGGFLGSIFVVSVIMCVPKVGVASVVTASLCGQILLSIVLDHFGLLGMKQHSINISKVFGAGLIIAGIFLVNYRR